MLAALAVLGLIVSEGLEPIQLLILAYANLSCFVFFFFFFFFLKCIKYINSKTEDRNQNWKKFPSLSLEEF